MSGEPSGALTVSSQRKNQYFSALAKPPPRGEEQLALFEEFARNVPDSYTALLELFDSIPKFSLTPQTSTRKGGTIAIAKYEFKWGGYQCLATIAPVVVESRENPTRKSIRKEVLPGPREEVIYRVLRKMASEVSSKRVLRENTVVLQCTLYALRKRLESVGHGLRISQIREALEVLGGAALKVTNIETEKTLYSGSYLSIKYIMNESDATGAQSLVEIEFNRLAVTAIVKGLYDRIHYERLMGLSRPLSAWIYERLTRNFRQAGAECGYRLSLSLILRESGLIPHKDLRSNIRQVRQALNELVEKEVLAAFPTYKEEIKTVAKSVGRGRHAIGDVLWTVFPSPVVVKDVRSDNAAKQSRLRDNDAVSI